jgi:hypothetical protein
LRLSAGDIAYSIESNFDLPSLSGAPEATTDVWYSYRRLWGDDVPVESVEMRLGDYERRLTVTGTSDAHVDSILTSAADSLESHSALFGGYGHRSIVVFAGLWLIWTSIYILPSISSFASDPRFSRLFAFPLIVGVVLLMALSWWGWFPGTLVLPGDPSFVVRFGPHISLLSFLATMVFGVVTLWRKPDAPPPGR